LESLSISEWVSWVVNSLSGEVPGLVSTTVARPEDDVSVVGVRVSMDIKAVTTTISEVSVGSSPVVESLSAIIWNVLSNDNSSVESQELTSLIGDSIVSLVPGSDGS